MNTEKLRELSGEFQERGLYSGSFKSLCVSVHRQIDYANNVLLIESSSETKDEILAVYSIFEEATRCLYWTNENATEYVRSASARSFPIEQFRGLYVTHFRGSAIFEKIRSDEVVEVDAFRSPAYDDLCGEFMIRTKDKKYILMWDYCD